MAAIVGLSVLLVVIAVVVGWRSLADHGDRSTARTSARAAAQDFLRQWVDADGRVVRRDQGSDSVSEGQAYGMLLAVAADDQARFDQIWAWTRDHLQQTDSLLAWQWANGSVTDAQSAADADLDAVWALRLAGQRFHEPAHTAAAKTMAAAVLDRETVSTSTGPLLAAGPWARGEPATVNPSYVVGGTAGALARFTGDNRWTSLAAATASLDTSLLKSESLPPDWVSTASNQPAAAARAVGAPDGGSGIRYGLDAPRLLIRLATSCSTSDRELAATSTAGASVGEPAFRSLDGQAQVDWQHPLTDVAAAAVRFARGDQTGTEQALTGAEHVLASSPTYYGAAWAALGRILLTTDLLTDCDGS